MGLVGPYVEGDASELTELVMMKMQGMHGAITARLDASATSRRGLSRRFPGCPQSCDGEGGTGHQPVGQVRYEGPADDEAGEEQRRVTGGDGSGEISPPVPTPDYGSPLIPQCLRGEDPAGVDGQEQLAGLLVELAHRSSWAAADGMLPTVEGTVIRLDIHHEAGLVVAVGHRRH